ncbi:hypothetical protein V1282_003492 [Nitrobacteraceae bacterium AZCC 2146]
MSDPKTQIDFNAPATLTKWPSRSNKVHPGGGGCAPVFSLDGHIGRMYPAI